jgi:hypothetical protein
MATYTIIPRPGGDGFDIALIGDNGARQTMLGFASEADAKAWVEANMRMDKQQDAADGNRARLSSS